MMAQPKNPWSEEQLQSTPAGPPDAAPWKLTIAVTAILAVLALGALFLWSYRSTTQAPQATPASVR
jgi:MYXO-CTERM domain-containing protein